MLAHKIYKVILTITLFFLGSLTFAAVTPTVADSIERVLNGGTLPPDCQSCAAYAEQSQGASLSNIIFISILLLLATVWFYFSYKKKYIIVIGTILAALIVGSYFAAPFLRPNLEPENCPIIIQKSTGADVFKTPGNEFTEVSEATSATPSTAKTDVNTVAASDEFTTVGDSTTTTSSSDEFSTAGSDEFQTAEVATAPVVVKKPINYKMIYEPVVIFIILGFISLFIKYEGFRRYKGLFLLAAIVYLGFYRGACPCMISSFQGAILLGLGNPVPWENLLWFLLLIPATYLFGKVWCGWLCHLGALQEFIYRSPKMKILSTVKAQKVLKIIQISMLVLLVVQLIITHTNIWCTIDPFLVAFNLFSSNITGYVLLVIMLLSSVFIYRPFCRGFCPVGLILGWVSLIPGAKRLNKNSLCIDCISCSHQCKEHAMIHENKKTMLNTQDCIMCGDCFSSCKKDALTVNRKK